MISKNALAVFCSAALLAFSPLAQAQAANERPHRILSLTGTGEVKARPDTASINSGVTSNAKTAQEALAANSAAMNKLFRELKAAGIADQISRRRISASRRNTSLTIRRTRSPHSSALSVIRYRTA